MPTTLTPYMMLDPGFLWLAPANTAFPTLGGTASGSIFTDSPSVTFYEIGATEAGYTFSYSQTIEAINVAEFADPVKWRTTARQGSMAFNMADYTLKNVQRSMNGGTLTLASGTQGTGNAVNKWTPPAVGSETRAALLWQSLDGTMRIFMYQTVQVNEMETAFKKAPDFAVLPCEFRFEIDASGNIFEVYTAGPTRYGN
jgi:hypothetical protein